VEAHSACVVLENQCRAGLVLGMSLNMENVFVPEVVENLVLSPSCAFESFTFSGRGGSSREIEANEAFTGGRLRMLRFPVLIKTDRILKKQLGEFVVADTTGALRLSDARLFHCTADCTSGRSIELSVWGGIQSIC